MSKHGSNDTPPQWSDDDELSDELDNYEQPPLPGGLKRSDPIPITGGRSLSQYDIWAPYKKGDVLHPADLKTSQEDIHSAFFSPSDKDVHEVGSAPTTDSEIWRRAIREKGLVAVMAERKEKDARSRETSVKEEKSSTEKPSGQTHVEKQQQKATASQQKSTGGGVNLF